MTTESVLLHLLTPICQLRESCELWRAYACSELQRGSSADVDRDDARLGNCFRLPCESRDVSWLEDDTYVSARSKESGNIRQRIQYGRKSFGQRVSAASFKSSSEQGVTAATESAVSYSQDALRKAAVAEWHARKSAEIRSGYKTSAQRAKEDEEKRAQAEQDKRDEGKAAYESWMKKKQESGWTKKNKGNDEEEEKARAEAAKAKQKAEAAIEKWRARKEAETSRLKRERRRRQQEEETAKAAVEEEKREKSSRAKQAWTEKKRQQDREKTRTRLQTEHSKADEELGTEAKQREKARKAYEEWCGKKDNAPAGPVSDSAERGGKKFLGPAWRPNSTVRPK